MTYKKSDVLGRSRRSDRIYSRESAAALRRAMRRDLTYDRIFARQNAIAYRRSSIVALRLPDSRSLIVYRRLPPTDRQSQLRRFTERKMNGKLFQSIGRRRADTDKRVRREYMRFVWRKRRAHICPDLFFACDSLRHSSGVHIPLPRGAAGMSFCSSGSPAFCICCFSRISPPRCSVAAGERPARVYDFTRRIPSSCTAAEAKKKRRCSPISRRSSASACSFFLRAENGCDRFKRAPLFRAKPKPSPRSFRRAAAEITAFSDRRGRRAVLAVGAILLAAVITVCAGVLGIKYEGRGYAKSEGERSGAHLGGAERVLEIAAPRTIGALCAVDCVSEALGQRPKCGAFPHTEFRGIRRRTDCVPVGLIAAENAHRIPR